MSGTQVIGANSASGGRFIANHNGRRPPSEIDLPRYRLMADMVASADGGKRGDGERACPAATTARTPHRLPLPLQAVFSFLAL